MTRRATTMVTTACIGMALGTAAYMATNQKGVKNKGRKLRKNTGKALRQVGGFIDNLSYMMQ